MKNTRLRMIPGRMVTCCDFSNPDYPKICNTHLNAQNLVNALLETSKPLDDKVKFELHRSCGHVGAILFDGK